MQPSQKPADDMIFPRASAKTKILICKRRNLGQDGQAAPQFPSLSEPLFIGRLPQGLAIFGEFGIDWLCVLEREVEPGRPRLRPAANISGSGELVFKEDEEPKDETR